MRKHGLLYMLLSALLLLPCSANAQSMADYTCNPIFTSNTVKPNILILVDNSGNMNLMAYGYDDQGFLKEDDKGLLHLRYNDLIALLTKAIQDQQAIIEEQAVKMDIQNELIEEQSSDIANQKIEIRSFKSKLGRNEEEQQRMNKRLTEIEQLLNTTQL